jgi:hypothetical protein
LAKKIEAVNPKTKEDDSTTRRRRRRSNTEVFEI